MEHHNHRDNHSHDPHEGVDSTSLAELLDLDAEVLHSYLLDVTTWIRQLVTESPSRILDLGAGTGTGTVALAQCFSDAEVLAVDRSEDMLTRVRVKAQELEIADRVHPVQADVDVAWPDIEAVDLVWAALSLHELADPDRVLKDAFATIRPGGLLAVTELDSLPRFLPHDIGLGRPGLEERCHDALEQEQTGWHHPDWGPHLEQIGFETPAKRTFTIDLAPPQPTSTGRYARAYLGRIRPTLEGRLATGDLDTLNTLLAGDGPDSLLHRDDLIVRCTRTAWVARRP